VIRYFNEEIKPPDIKRRVFNKWIQSIVSLYRMKVGDINFIFCSDQYLLQINKEYLQHDYFTDIITFNNNSDNIISGDIYLSLETIATNAYTYQVSFSDELKRVMIHGILHLIGFDDKNNDQQIIMRQKEDEALNMFES
jgi:probable rRNA maturation factor